MNRYGHYLWHNRDMTKKILSLCVFVSLCLPALAYAAQNITTPNNNPPVGDQGLSPVANNPGAITPVDNETDGSTPTQNAQVVLGNQYPPRVVPITGHVSPPKAFVTLAKYEGSPILKDAIQADGLVDYLNVVFRILLSVGALAAVLRLTWAGYLYMGSADMWSTKEAARKMFTDTIIGLLILFAVYIILFQIDKNLLNLDILKSLQSIKAEVIGPPLEQGGIGHPQ